MATQKGRSWSSGDIVTAANLGSIERGVSALAEEYTPTTWSNGDTVTAAGLNNIEQGIVDGGSSDFGTAQVTFVNNSESYFECPMAVIQDGEMYFPAISEEGTYTVPLYNGSVILPSIRPTSVSGNAEIKGSGLSAYVFITGDCTITISDSSGGQTAA